jgi:cyclophilin family peptidyl-prolyl cis-trans isomerase
MSYERPYSRNQKESVNMRSRAVLYGISALMALGIIGGLVYLKSQKPAPDSVTDTSSLGAAPDTSPTPEASLSPSEPKTTNMSPDLMIDANGLSKATAIITTNRGVIRFKFYPKDAPNTVTRIIELINKGFYNGLKFHRVVPGFVVQGGDPQGNGTGGSGQKLKAEFNDRKHVEGAVAMARAQSPDSADSQFYIALAPQPHLDRSYTVFGQVIEGMDVVKQLQPDDEMISVIIE